MSDTLTPQNAVKSLKFCIGMDLALGLVWLIFLAGLYFLRIDIFDLPGLRQAFYYLTLSRSGEPVFTNDFFGHMVISLCLSIGFIVVSLLLYDITKGWKPAEIGVLAKRFLMTSIGVCVAVFVSYFVFFGWVVRR